MVAACPFPCGRGTPIRIQRLAEALVSRGHEVHVVTYHLGEPIALSGVSVHRVPRVPTYRRLEPGPSVQKLLVIDLLLAWKLARILRAHDFDVIHAHHIEGVIAALLARPHGRTPLLFDAHTLVQSELPHYGAALPRLLKRGVGWLFDRTLPLRADYIVAVTEEIRARLVALGAEPERIAVIANGVECDLFEEARRRDREGRNERIIVFTGSLAAYQGVEAMLRAFALVHARRPEVRLMIVSRTPFTAFEPLARALGIRPAIEVVEAGFEAVPGRLAMSDIALNPRLDTPGLPHKTLNYMAAGVPIVSFTGSGKHLVDGETALLVSGDGGVAGFAAAIERLLDDPELAERIGASARALVQSEMTWARSAELIECAYDAARAVAAVAEPVRTARRRP
jgi:glycosyltransferase involved in cell wall biosynthesis